VGYLYVRALWMLHVMYYGDAALVVERHERLHNVVQVNVVPRGLLGHVIEVGTK